MQATVEATRQYWWLFAVIGAIVAVGLVLWRMPSLRASFAAMRCAKPEPARRRVVEAESEYETDSDAGELAEERLLAHLKPEARAEPRPEPEPERAPKRRGPGRKREKVTRECTE